MNTRGLFTKSKQKSLALVSVFSEHLLSLMCRHLLTLSFFSAGHDILLTSNSVFQYRKIRAVRQERVAMPCQNIYSQIFCVAIRRKPTIEETDRRPLRHST